MITRDWLDQNPDYTCGCGLYVHPIRRNYSAIHISDCQFAMVRKVIEWVPGKWWIVDDKPGFGYTPIAGHFESEREAREHPEAP